MSGDTLVYILLALPATVSIATFFVLRPDRSEDDTDSFANGDIPTIPNGFTRGD